MERIRFISYKGKSILLEDFSNLRPGKEFADTIAEAQKLITAQPPGSVLAVLDATQVSFNAEVLTAMKDFVRANTPYIRCSAVVGITGLLNVAVNTLSRVGGRAFRSFPTREAAMDFLIAQS